MKEDKTCKICGKVFTRRNYMQKHMENIHSKRYSCPKCFRFFSGPIEHSCAIDNGRFLCYVRDCSLRFSNGMAMRLHIRDCHRKVEAENVGDVMKSKKGIREIIQTLCKKINLLNNCFDELKYQVDTISGFLKSKNFDFELEKPQNAEGAALEQVVTEEKSEEDNKEFEDIFFIDEEYEDYKMTDNQILYSVDSDNKTAIKLNEYITTPKADVSFQPPLNVSDVQVQHPNISEPNQIFVSTIKSPSALPVIDSAAKPSSAIKSEEIISLPPTTTIGSTIITQVPTNIVKLQSYSLKPPTSFNTMNIKRRTPSATINSAKKESPTPPLFLKINYDPETTICTADPKITFHFDTKPPDEI